MRGFTYWKIYLLKFMSASDKSDALHDLVLFEQFKKHEKHPWKSVAFSNIAGFSVQHY